MIYTVMANDTVRVQYLASGRWGNRLEIDARNLVQKPLDWSVTVAELYNDKKLEPTTRVFEVCTKTSKIPKN